MNTAFQMLVNLIVLAFAGTAIVGLVKGLIVDPKREVKRLRSRIDELESEKDNRRAPDDLEGCVEERATHAVDATAYEARAKEIAEKSVGILEIALKNAKRAAGVKD